MAGTAAGPAQRYLEQLSDADLALLGLAAGLVDPGTRPAPTLAPSPPPTPTLGATTIAAGLGDPDDIERAAGVLRTRPELVEPALSSPGAFRWLFPEGAETAEVT